MKQIILTALFIAIFAVSIKADSGDSVYTITRGQLMTSLLDTRAAIDAFMSELQGFTGKQLTDQGIKRLSTKQDDLNARVRAYLVLYDYIPDIPDEFRREHNMASNICSQNGGRVKDLIAASTQNNTQGTAWIIDMLKSIFIAQFPYLEFLINKVLK